MISRGDSEVSDRSGGVEVEQVNEPATFRRAVDVGIKEWLKTYMDNDALSECEKQAFLLLSGVNDWWSYEAFKRKVSDTSRSLTETLTAMQQSIDKLEKKMDNKSTYAAVVSRGAEHAPMTRLSVNNNNVTRVMEEQRKLRTLRVCVTDPKDKVNVRLEHIKDLLDKASRALREGGKPAGLRRLPSGDLEFQMATVQDRQKAEGKTNWTKVIAGTAQMKRRRYGVIAHGVRMINVNTNNQSQSIQRLIAQNTRIHKNLSINKVA